MNSFIGGKQKQEGYCNKNDQDNILGRNIKDKGCNLQYHRTQLSTQYMELLVSTNDQLTRI